MLSGSSTNTGFLNPEKYSSNSIIKKNIRAFRTPYYQRRPFYSAFVPTHKSFTSLVTTRKSYARGARTNGRDLFRAISGNEKK